MELILYLFGCDRLSMSYLFLAVVADAYTGLRLVERTHVDEDGPNTAPFIRQRFVLLAQVVGRHLVHLLQVFALHIPTETSRKSNGRPI